jgi:hypothetical protein
MKDLIENSEQETMDITLSCVEDSDYTTVQFRIILLDLLMTIVVLKLSSAVA